MKYEQIEIIINILIIFCNKIYLLINVKSNTLKLFYLNLLYSRQRVYIFSISVLDLKRKNGSLVGSLHSASACLPPLFFSRTPRHMIYFNFIFFKVKHTRYGKPNSIITNLYTDLLARESSSHLSRLNKEPVYFRHVYPSVRGLAQKC